MLNFFLFVTLCTALARSNPNFLTKPRLNGHIVGGIDATIEEYPHQIALYYNNYFFCGGSIYSKNVVITAAHCVSDKTTSDLAIYAGTTLLSKRITKFSISKVYVHEKYSSKTIECDMAILIINGEFEFNSRVQPIALAESRPPLDTEVTSIGWGLTSSGGSGSDHLLQVYMNIISQKDCTEAYGNRVTDNMICAGIDEGEGGTCSTDSGGPLILDKKLLGIVSWGSVKYCGFKDYPDVYASVPELRDWILQTVQRHNAASE